MTIRTTKPPPRKTQQNVSVKGRVNWDVLKRKEKQAEFRSKTEGLTLTTEGEGKWGSVCGKLVSVAKQTCGTIPKETIIPWMKGRENEAAAFKDQIVETTRIQREATRQLKRAEERNENTEELRKNVKEPNEKKEAREKLIKRR